MYERSIKTLLFSDIKGFSKMSERECFLFCKTFHSGIHRDILSKYAPDILLQNTWGDALHLVFDNPIVAGHLALDLCEWVRTYDWKALGLRNPIDIRISLHVGVVTKIPDPILQNYNYAGRNTSKAARIEPITFEGQVFVSGTYAALLSVHKNHTLTCDYVGVRQLPKNAGSLQVYLLRRRVSPAVIEK